MFALGGFVFTVFFGMQEKMTRKPCLDLCMQNGRGGRLQNGLILGLCEELRALTACPALALSAKAWNVPLKEASRNHWQGQQ